MAKFLRTVKQGGLKIDILHYADGRYGFDWQTNEFDRKQIRRRTQEGAEKKAKELIEESKAGVVDLRDVDLDDYAEFLRWRSQREKAQPVKKLVERFLAVKNSKGLSGKHVRGIESTLSDFQRAFPCLVTELTREKVESWLEGKEVGPRRWNNILADVVALVRFARREGVIGAELSPVELIERKKVTVKILTYTPAELKEILSSVAKEWMPVIALGAFCGLRPEEIAPENRNEKEGLKWENILWSKNKVDVPAAVSKTRRRRFAPLPDAAKAFLAEWKTSKGHVAPGGQRFCHYLPKLKRANERITWKPDALRHSFASYRLAVLKDIQELSLEMGNSPSMIHAHYLDLKHEDEAAEWFSIRP